MNLRRNSSLLAALVAACPLASVNAELPRSSDSFVDTIGVNIHALHHSGPYANWSAVEQAISDIGIRSVRDIPDDYTKLNALSAATGANIDVIMQQGETVPGCTDMSKLPTVLQNARNLGNNIGLLEGPNEPDFQDNFQQGLRDWQSALYTQSKADPLLSKFPVLAPSLNQWTAPTMTDLGPYVDAGNFHHYAQYGQALTYNFWPRYQSAQTVSGSKPMYITETGYHNAVNYANTAWAGVPENIAAKYLTTGFMDMFNDGVVKSYVYELVEEDENPANDWIEAHLGLLRTDFRYKPAATALKNVISLLRDPDNNFSPSNLDYTITGGDSSLHHTLLQKSDGSYYLALWQDKPLYDADNKVELSVASQSLQLNFANAIDNAEVYLPTFSTSASAQYLSSLSQLNVSVGDQMVMLRLDAPPLNQPLWKMTANGDWNDSGNWTTGVPNGVGAQAYFGSADVFAHTVTSSASTLTLGKLTINSPNKYTIAGASTLTMQMSSGAAAIDVRQGEHEIALPVTFASNATITVAAGAALNLSGGATINAFRRVTLDSPGATRVADLNITSGGSVDVKNHAFVTAAASGWSGGDYSGLAAMVKDGRIMTSMPAAATGATTIAVASAGEFGISTYAGQSVSAGDTIVAYTFNGDANLDGKVSADDYFAIDSNLNKSGLVHGFAKGDFNYDGLINGDDYVAIDAGFSAQSSSSLSAASLAVVPEPLSSVALLAAVVPLAVKRRHC